MFGDMIEMGEDGLAENKMLARTRLSSRILNPARKLSNSQVNETWRVVLIDDVSGRSGLEIAQTVRY